MWVKSRAAITRWMAPEVPRPSPPTSAAPSPPPVPGMNALQEDLARRRKKYLEAQRVLQAEAAAMEQARREADEQRRRDLHEQIMHSIAARGYWLPHDYLPRERPSGFLSRLLDALRGR